jgi:hypothetical protein
MHLGESDPRIPHGSVPLVSQYRQLRAIRQGLDTFSVPIQREYARYRLLTRVNIVLFAVLVLVPFVAYRLA